MICPTLLQHGYDFNRDIGTFFWKDDNIEGSY